jgi:hAT family C-terminal dimerisation region
MLISQIGNYVQGSGTFEQGNAHRGTDCEQPISSVGWWRIFGAGFPEPTSVAVTVLSLSPSSWSVERSFSQQKRIRSLNRNRLMQTKVKKLMYVHWNLWNHRGL